MLVHWPRGDVREAVGFWCPEAGSEVWVRQRFGKRRPAPTLGEDAGNVEGAGGGEGWVGGWRSGRLRGLGGFLGDDVARAAASLGQAVPEGPGSLGTCQPGPARPVCSQVSGDFGKR